ncbi:hypothetical protein SEUCBS139899_009850 [Sporothrix eucalyptigena]|uniref:Uncharacterized protein n=1 Tax=Sporothrix eucalyptigena TaxID=1812306 RepID=A0ABP0CZ27_9PEZI
MVHEFPNRFAGKVVAITGAASGMGAAMTKRYIAEGAKVLVADMCDEAKGQDFVSQFPKGTAHFHHCDVAVPEQATGVVTETIKQFGDIDIVHNHAAAGTVGAITDMDPKTWSHVFAVSVDAAFYISRAAIPEMMKHTADKRGNKGVIINTVSISGITPDGGLACYSAAKAALANLTKGMAADHARDGIRVNAVAPGPTRSAMSTQALADPVLREAYLSAVPVKRIGEPEELAAAMMFLASDDASFITGAILNVDGGSLAVSRSPDMRDALKGTKDDKRRQA